MHDSNDDRLVWSRTQSDTNHTIEDPAVDTKGRPVVTGILQKITEIPLDVLFEIFHWLNPIDLLDLSRTSKSWRSLMMSPLSIPVWRNARSKFPGLPDCPGDLSEPQYANLAFGSSCHFCDRVVANTQVSWEARLRTCEECLDTCFMDKPVYRESEPTSPYEMIMNNIPTLNIRKRSGCIMWITAVVPINLYVRLLENYKEAKDQNAWLVQYEEKQQSIKRHAKACSNWYDRYRYHQRLRGLESQF